MKIKIIFLIIVIALTSSLIVSSLTIQSSNFVNLKDTIYEIKETNTKNWTNTKNVTINEDKYIQEEYTVCKTYYRYVLNPKVWLCNSTNITRPVSNCSIITDNRRCYYSTKNYNYCATGWTITYG